MPSSQPYNQSVDARAPMRRRCSGFNGMEPRSANQSRPLSCNGSRSLVRHRRPVSERRFWFPLSPIPTPFFPWLARAGCMRHGLPVLLITLMSRVDLAVALLPHLIGIVRRIFRGFQIGGLVWRRTGPLRAAILVWNGWKSAAHVFTYQAGSLLAS